MAIDLGAMAYMWSPSGFQAPLTWLLVAYFVVQSLLWMTDRMREVDHKTLLGGGFSVTPDGAVAMSPPSRWSASATCACRCSR